MLRMKPKKNKVFHDPETSWNFHGFSEIEKQHLLKSWLAVSLAFTILNTSLFSFDFIIYFVISLFTVGLGFIFHELGHKYIAQKYGCFAEYRANNQMLIIGILTAFFGFLFIAPGAVVIKGIVTKKRNGIISLAGPLANIILAIVFIIISLFINNSFFSMILSYGVRINYFLAVFNMIPILNFDGRKIWAYNKAIYIITIVVGLLILPMHEILLSLV